MPTKAVTPTKAAQFDVWSGVVGQERTTEFLCKSAAHPVHAYLFVGAPGVGVEESAIAFAALLLTDHLEGEQRQDAQVGVLHESHPDLVVARRKGASILRDQITQQLIPTAMQTPMAANRRVLILHEAHLLEDGARSALLKTLEEPASTSVFILCAEIITPELATIASRCSVLEFAPLDNALVVAQLVHEGIGEHEAQEIGLAAGGRLDRARMLAKDAAFRVRYELWKSIPRQLEGSGSVISRLVDEVLSSVDSVIEPLQDQHKHELSELRKLAKEIGSERGLGKAEMDKRHRRELRRLRTDEIRAGLSALQLVYRQMLVSSTAATSDSAPLIDASRTNDGANMIDGANTIGIANKASSAASALRALEAIQRAQEAIRYNPNERLLLSALLWRIAD